MVKLALNSAANTVRKDKNAGQYFLVFSDRCQKLSFSRLLKLEIALERVNSVPQNPVFNSLPNDTILDQSNLKDNKIKFTEKL